MPDLFKVLFACCLISATGTAFAAGTADLKVTGTIVPASCTPSFSGGGTVDYGKISAKDLSPTQLTSLPDKHFTYSITCSVPTKIALNFSDARPVVGTSTDFNATTKTAGKNEAVYYMWHQTVETLADGNSVDGIFSIDSGSTWTKMTSGVIYRTADRLDSFATKGTLSPTAFKVFTGKIKLKVDIFQTNGLDITKEIPIDGLAALTVIYI